MIRRSLTALLSLALLGFTTAQQSEDDQVRAILGTNVNGLVFNGHFSSSPASQVGGTINYEWVPTDSRDSAAEQALHRGIVRFSGSATSWIDLNAQTGPQSCGQQLGLFGGVNPAFSGDRTGVTFELVAKFDAVANWAKPFDLSTGAGIDSMTMTWDGASDGQGRMLIEQYVNATAIRSVNWDKANMEFFRPNIGEWYHMTIVMKPATTDPTNPSYGAAFWYVYLNGQQWALADRVSRGAAFTPLQTANYPRRVARQFQYIAKSGWNDPYMQQSVDAFRVYDFALTSDEIARLAAIYGLNKSSSALPTPAMNQPIPTDNPENNKHRTSFINFDPIFKVDFAVDPRPYVGGSIAYEWMQTSASDSAADRAAHTGIGRFNGAATNYVDLMTATGPNSVGKVMPTLFDGSSGTDTAYGWTIDVVVKPLAIQTWAKFYSLGSGPDYDAIFMGWVADSNVFEVGNYINIRDDLKFERLGYTSFYRAPTLNRWTHLTVVLQPKAPGPQPMANYNATWSLYVDGQLVARNDRTTNYPVPVVRRYSSLGQSNWAADANVRMEMDVFRVWDRALNADQVESLANAYSCSPVDGGDWAWKQALGTGRVPVYDLDFQYNPTQNGQGPTSWQWTEQDPTDSTVIAGQHTGLAVLDGTANSFIDLDALTGPNRVYDNLAMPQVGGPTTPGGTMLSGWSFELVFKATGWNAWAKLISLSNNRDDDEIMIGFDAADNNMIVQNYIQDNVYNAWAYAAVEVMKPTVIGKWYHLVVVMRPGSVPGAGNWQVYVNGQLQEWAARLMPGMTCTEIQGCSFPRAVPRTNSWIAKGNWGDPNMRVVVDAFRIYDYVLTSQQVSAFATAYGCRETVPVLTPADNRPIPVTAETTNWQAAGITTGPIFNAVFPENPGRYIPGGVTDYGYVDVDPNDPPEVAAFHRGCLVFNGSNTAWADLNTLTGPNSIGMIAPIIGGVGSGFGATRGLTAELVVKLTEVETWGKLFMLASGPNLDALSMGWNGNNLNTLETQNWNSIKAGLTQKGAVEILNQPPLNEWLHIAVAYQLVDDARWDGAWTAYVNGEVVARKTAAQTPFPANFPLPIYRQYGYIAKSAWPGDPTATMVLDMMRVYDYVLSQDQIRGTAMQYGLYGNSRPNPTPSNFTLAFDPTPESTAAASAVVRQPLLNAWFGHNPTTKIYTPTPLNYEWLEFDPDDTPANRALHRGVVKIGGGASSYVDLTTNRGPNSCGVVLPRIGGAGAGRDATAGWTFEIVFKVNRMDSWAKLFNFGNGPELATIGLGVDGTDRTTMNAEVFDTQQPKWPHGFTEYWTPVLGKWYHAVFQIAPVNMTEGSAVWYFYINGNLINNADQLHPGAAFTPVQGAAYPRYTERRFSAIGKSNWNDPLFSGVVDAMRVYDYLLTKQQIVTLATQYGCNEPSLALPTPALNNPRVNPVTQPEVQVWNREGISAPVFNGNFAIDPRVEMGGALSSYNYDWFAVDTTDSPTDQGVHKGIIKLRGVENSFIDLVAATGPNSVGLVHPVLFGPGSGQGNEKGWTVEMVLKVHRQEVWSKFFNAGTGGSDWFDSFAISWWGELCCRNSWVVQNYNNYNPVAGQIVEKSAMKFVDAPSLERWYHLTVVVQPTPPYNQWGAVWRVYIDGTLVNRTTTERFPMPVFRDNSMLGRSQFGSQDPNSLMSVDAFRIYDKALLPRQVAALARQYGATNPRIVDEADLPVDPNDYGGGQGSVRWSSTGASGGNGGNNGGDAGSSSSSSLGGGAIAGIVIGCVLGAALLCAVAFFMCLSPSRGSKKSSSEGYPKNNTSYDEMEPSRQSQVNDDIEMTESETA